MAKALNNKKPRFIPTSDVFSVLSRDREKSFTELERVEAREFNDGYTGIKKSASPHCTRAKIATIIVIVVAICLVVGIVVIFTRNEDDGNRGSPPTTTPENTVGKYCSMNCRIGSLDSRCDACFCSDNIITGKVYSKSTGNPLGIVSVYSKIEPTSQIALSNLTGHFSLDTNCTPSELFFLKEGFVDTFLDVNSSYFEIEMARIVKPYLTVTPQSKNRLTTENVTFCCEAAANPGVLYYEWYKNHIILDNNVYANQTQLTLSNLSTHDSGEYQCKARSNTGAIMSEVADLNVKVEPNDFCKEALQPKLSQLPDDCVQEDTNSTLYEVHECISVRCRNYFSSKHENCEDESNYCCSMKDFQIVQVNCSEYIIELVDAKSCECDACAVPELTVSGTATGHQDETPVKFGSVYVNGDMKGYTTYQGTFEYTFQPLFSKMTINIQDNFFNEFLPAVKVIKLSDDRPDILKVDIKMIRAAYPVKMNSSVENMLQAGPPRSSNVSNVLLTVPANAFYYENGSQFLGIVEARLTFLDPLDISAFDNIPGTFEFIDEEGEAGELVSLGVFNLFFEDISGNPLLMNKIIDAYIPLSADTNETYSDVKLWTLNIQTGIWELEGSSGESRRKRDNLNSWIGALADVSRQKWYNYDKVYRLSNNQCFFKFDLYKSRAMASTISTLPMLKFTIHIVRGITVHSIVHYTRRRTCFNIVCDNEDAYITVFPYDVKQRSINISGLYPPSYKVEQSISTSERVLTAKLSSSSDGPFYQTRSQCSASNSDSDLRAFFDNFDYEWKFKEKSSMCNQNEAPEIRMQTWYQHFLVTGYSVCFVKIKIDIDKAASIIANEMKIRVRSYIGTFKGIKDKLIGIHETKMKESRKSYCLEYRCSGKIDSCISTSIDDTKVEIIFEYPSKYIKCEVDMVNLKQSFISMYSENGEKFIFYAESDGFGTEKGIYSINGDSIDNVRSMTKDYCEKAVQPPASSQKPISDDGYAVAFRCKVRTV